MFTCENKNCGATDYGPPEGHPSCVWRNELVKDTTTRLENVLSALNKDPTLQRSDTVECAKCMHNVAVFFQAEVTA